MKLASQLGLPISAGPHILMFCWRETVASYSPRSSYSCFASSVPGKKQLVWSSKLNFKQPLVSTQAQDLDSVLHTVQRLLPSFESHTDKALSLWADHLLKFSLHALLPAQFVLKGSLKWPDYLSQQQMREDGEKKKRKRKIEHGEAGEGGGGGGGANTGTYVQHIAMTISTPALQTKSHTVGLIWVWSHNCMFYSLRLLNGQTC